MAEGPAGPCGGSHESGGDMSLRARNVREHDRLLFMIHECALIVMASFFVIMSVYNSEHNTPINSDHDDDINDYVTRISKLDISDPLHLHPNDTTALTVVSIKLKGIENYQVWSCAMLLALERKNKIGFIDGSCKRSNTDENGSSIADYYHKLNALWKQYDAMIELPKCICNASKGFKKHNQLLKLMQFFMGLDDSYMQIRSSILSRETLRDVRSAYATISSEESHRIVRNNQNFNAGPSRPNNVNNTRQGGGSGLNNNIPSGGSGLVCENYGFNGHTIDRCFKIIGYPADFEKKKSGQNVKKQGVSNNNYVEKSSSSGFTDKQMATLISLIKDNKVRKNVQANMAGANQHMTYTDKELNNVIDISHLNIKVGHPNGTEAYISKIGNLRLSNGLNLYDVMVIPEYYVTLVSVHKLVKENKHDWHCRLGHSADPVLNVLEDSLNFDKSDNTGCCEICQKAKQTREPFPLSDHKSKYLGDLVHLDLWRPYKVASSEGFRFFLTVVDDYTRAVWGGIPLKMWTECILTATYLINRLLSYVLNGKSPYEMIYKKCPTISYLRVFGCLYFDTVVNNNDKFSSRSEKCVMIGYYNFKKGYRLYSLDKHQFIFSRDVKLFENIFSFKDSKVGKNDSTNVFQDVNHINFFDIEYPEIPNDDERVANDLNKGKSDSSSSSESGDNINTTDLPVDSGNDDDSNNDFVVTLDEEVATLEENIFSEGNLDQNPSSSQGIQNVRRSSRQSVFSKKYNDFVVESKVKYGLEKYVSYSKINSKKICFISQPNKIREPKTYFEASKYSHWIDAMNQEMNALLRNGTWSSGEIDIYKARLVAQGFRQKERIDYEETFSSVVKMVTVRCLLNIVVSMSWPVFQLDVNNAFLYGDLEEVVYMKPPEGYFPSDNKSDKGVFLALLVYVDDIIITGNSVFKIEKFKLFLKSKFMIKDLGKLKYFLGIKVVDTDKCICLNQRKYVLDLLFEYGMLACKPAKTPFMPKLVISNEASDKDPLLENITDYQKLMGKFIYLTNTRPDISYVVHCLSQFMHSLLTSHLKITFKILRYLKSCPGLGVHITKISGMFLTAYSDAD
nr:ribonuclease H-like domain-containing protein [Tanacetum cinerariifolium]